MRPRTTESSGKIRVVALPLGFSAATMQRTAE